MVHNGIEYGLMQAYAEGLNVLKHANIGGPTYKYALDLRDHRGLATRLRDRLVAARPDGRALQETPELEEIRAA